MASETTRKVNIFAFDDFETIVTARRLEALKRAMSKIFLDGVKERLTSMPPTHTFFKHASIHRVAASLTLSYLDPKVSEDVFVTESMDDEAKEKAIKAGKAAAANKLFNMKKQLCIYVLTDTNPYDKKYGKNTWGSMMKKFKIEPLNNEIKREVRKIGREVNKDYKLYTYFPFEDGTPYNFRMRVDTQNLKVINPRTAAEEADEEVIVNELPKRTDYRDAAKKAASTETAAPKLIPVPLPGTGAKNPVLPGKGNRMAALDSDLDTDSEADGEITTA